MKKIEKYENIISATNKVIEKEETELTNFKSVIKKKILITSFAFSLLLSLTCIQVIAKIYVSCQTNVFGKALFEFADVIITAGILAGGSDAIHKIFNVYNNFTNTLAKK